MSNAKESVIDFIPSLAAPPPPSDADLVSCARQGDREAFDALVRRHKDRLYNMLYWYLGSHGDAEDTAQEAFVRAYLRLDRFRGEAAFSTWLQSIALNLARNRIRDRGRKGRSRGVPLEEDEAGRGYASPAPTPRAAAVYVETEAALERCLQALDERLRLAFVLRVFESLSYHDIAEATSAREGTVKSRLNEARARLRRCLGAAGVL